VNNNDVQITNPDVVDNSDSSSIDAETETDTMFETEFTENDNSDSKKEALPLLKLSKHHGMYTITMNYMSPTGQIDNTVEPIVLKLARRTDIPDVVSSNSSFDMKCTMINTNGEKTYIDASTWCTEDNFTLSEN